MGLLIQSIAPDLDDFSNSESRDYKQVYSDHVNGEELLPNRFYLASKVASEDAVETIIDDETGLYTYQTISSEIEVEGMFNINSVSLDAWKAILKHSRGGEVPYIDKSGVTSISSTSDTTFPYPRTSIAGDQSTNSGSDESADPSTSFDEAANFAGYAELTEEEVDALAEEIIKEIRLRGPFLSLSEFVNRQLSTDKDLAIASAIQKALNNLSEMGNAPENPFKEIQQIAHEVTNAPHGDADYAFPEAALGSSAFGVPGWVRQADILMPLAPIMTARDDTFTIRAYGDVRDSTGKVVARAWCEATVVRGANYVDSADERTVSPYSDEMTSDVNKRFGRRYEIQSFRWLNESEI